jgi:hypothetical protein
MDPITASLEPADVVEVRREASADAIVLGAWTEHRVELYAFVGRAWMRVADGPAFDAGGFIDTMEDHLRAGCVM